MSDTLEILKGLAVQVRGAIEENENTAERVGRLFVGILDLIEHSCVSLQDFDALFVKLLKLHIDNKTILWNEAEKYIYAVGGSATKTYTITVGVDESLGVRGEILPARQNTVIEGGSLTVRIVPDNGYVVQRVNVDKVSQGAITEYTFENVQSDHTMYVWFETEVEANPTDWLERSDLPGTYYSSYQEALDAVMEDYPDRLTQDVEITCVKEDVRYLTDGLWACEVKDWNKGSDYTLTINGDGKVNLDCNNFGGFSLTNVDNVVFENMTITNVANKAKRNANEELAAVLFSGAIESYARNLCVHNCTINGKDTNTDKFGQFAIVANFVESIYIDNCLVDKFDYVALKLYSCLAVSLVKNYVNSSHSYSYSHSSIISATSCNIIIAEDNEFTGNAAEYGLALVDSNIVEFRRNYFHDINGNALRITGLKGMTRLLLESNLFVNIMASPTVAWIFNMVIVECPIDNLTLLSNTANLYSRVWQQWFVRITKHVKAFESYNNIFSFTGDDTIPVRCVRLESADSADCGHNLFHVKVKEDGSNAENIFTIGEEVGGSLSDLQSLGYETDSHVAGNKTPVFDTDVNNRYAILDELSSTYPADNERVPQLDLKYRKKASDNSIGCYNNKGAEFDESADNTTGYNGLDVTDSIGFGHSAKYDFFADNILLIRANTLRRDAFVTYSFVGEHYTSLLLGRYGVVKLLPKLDANDEYEANEIYTVKMEVR